MSNRPHSRVKRVSNANVKVEKKEIKSPKTNIIKNIIGALIKK